MRSTPRRAILPLVLHDLPALEAHLFWLDPTALAANRASNARAWSWLDEKERARHERIACDRQRQEHLAAHALLRASLSRYAPVPPPAWHFVEDEHGCPSVAPEHGCSWLRFSLSHVAGLVAVAVARERAVGVDAEDLERRVDMAAIARRFFAPLELASLEALATEELRRERFFAYWTLKESYLKARGLGLALSLSSIVFRVDDAASALLLEPQTETVDGRPVWQFMRLSPTARHRVAVCIARASGEHACSCSVREICPTSWIDG